MNAVPHAKNEPLIFSVQSAGENCAYQWLSDLSEKLRAYDDFTSSITISVHANDDGQTHFLWGDNKPVAIATLPKDPTTGSFFLHTWLASPQQHITNQPTGTCEWFESGEDAVGESETFCDRIRIQKELAKTKIHYHAHDDGVTHVVWHKGDIIALAVVIKSRTNGFYLMRWSPGNGSQK